MWTFIKTIVILFILRCLFRYFRNKRFQNKMCNKFWRMKKKFQKKHYLADPYDVDEFKKFISDNININIKNTIFKKELKYFFDYYYRFFDKKE